MINSKLTSSGIGEGVLQLIRLSGYILEGRKEKRLGTKVIKDTVSSLFHYHNVVQIMPVIKPKSTSSVVIVHPF